MNMIIEIRAKKISVQLNLHAIRIYNNADLSGLLKENAEVSTDELIIHLKKEYFKLFNTDFKISSNSIAVEIWAHVYAEKFAKAVNSFSSIEFIDKIAEKIIHHAEVIDIGEHGHDDNRFVWDALAHLKPAIAKLLFFKQRI